MYEGCGSHSCRVVAPRGMGLNGLCTCHENRETARRAIAYLVDKVARLESAQAQATAPKSARDAICSTCETTLEIPPTVEYGWCECCKKWRKLHQ